MTKVYKRRTDYKPLFWIPNKTFLEILIYDEYTIVKSQVTYKKNNDQDLYRTKLSSHLELNGEDLVTVKFQLIIDNNPPKNIEIDKLKKVNEAIQISVPANSKIINESGGPVEMERVRVNVSVAYGSDIERVRQVLLEIGDSLTHVLKEPEALRPQVHFVEMGASSLDFVLRVLPAVFGNLGSSKLSSDELFADSRGIPITLAS